MKLKLFLLTFGVLFLSGVSHGKRDIEGEKTAEYWKNISKKELDAAIEKTATLNKNVAKNVIIFLGDGMGISTITAGRILKGQMRGESGEETKLTMETLPHIALSKTYNVDKQVADSASTATAYLCGVKTNYYTVGLNAATQFENCESSKGNEVNSILVDSYEAGKSTGVVTTTRIQHATPSGTYAHSASRNWYSDADLSDDAKRGGCKDIALQFYEASDMITVALAGGRKYMQPENTFDPEYPTKKNVRKDNKDLIQMWKNKMTGSGFEHEYVWNKEQFDAIDVGNTDRVLGLFEPSDMNYDVKRKDDGAGEPSIAEMTEKAIQVLQKNDNGYFLLVEGGRIDHGHHASNAHLSLHDVVAFDNAIEKALEMTSEEDTLIIITADHSHVFTIGGDADRGNDILGKAAGPNTTYMALDKKPYTTLVYANGPGFQGHYRFDPHGYSIPDTENLTMRANLTNVDTTAVDYIQQSAVPLPSETHGGEDVAIFARGPMSHLFHGVHEQCYIAYVMRYASCVGPNKDHCNQDMSEKEDTKPTVAYLGAPMSSESAQYTLTLQFVFLIILSSIILILLIFIAKNWQNFKAKPNYTSANAGVALSTKA